MEAQQALAFVARRAARKQMPATQWAHIMSLELGWMSPGEAKQYVAACRDAGLLAGEEELAPTFDTTIEIPRGFRPDPANRPESTQVSEDADLFATWLAKTAEATGQDMAAVLADMEALQATHAGLHADAAVLLLARRAGLDVQAAAAEALKAI